MTEFTLEGKKCKPKKKHLETSKFVAKAFAVCEVMSSLYAKRQEMNSCTPIVNCNVKKEDPIEITKKLQNLLAQDDNLWKFFPYLSRRD